MPKCKSKTKFLPATFAWVLLLGTTSLFFAFPCVRWYVLVQHWYAVPVFQGILTLFVLVNFSMATFMDPGVIPRASPDEDRDDDFRAPLYRNVEINGITVRMKWCVTCQFYRPPRCSHCSVCNNCIEIFDHHCPWVNNCIGRRNYRYFFMFLISLSLHMTSIFIFCLIHVLHRKDHLLEVAVIVSIVVMCIVALLFIPIFGLTGFHIVLVARGRTTNEQVTGKFRGGYNPFSKNCCYNCCFSLCGPQYPSLKHPAKYIGRKPRKYTVPVPVKSDVSNGGNSTPSGGLPGPTPSVGGGPGGGPSLRASGRRGPGQGVEPLAAQAAAAAQVRTYRDNGVKHSTSSYNRMSAASNELDPGSDVDEPMASQSKDAEPPLAHNSSKSNFFSEEEHSGLSRSRADDSVLSRSTVNTTVQYTPQQQQSVSSPYQNHARMLQQGFNSPHILQKPGKRSSTPEHMLSEGGVEMRALPRQAQSPTVTANKVRSMGGIATPLAGAPPPTVSSPGRYTGLTTPLYSHAPSTTYNPGYQPSRRYLSEGELLEPQQMMLPQGVGPSTSAGHIQELAGSPNRSFYLWKTDGSPPVPTYTSHQHMGPPPSTTHHMYATDPTSPNHPHHHHHHHPPPPPPATHSYAQQVGYYLQQQPPPLGGVAAADYLGPPSLQSGGPRTTPSGYPGGPVVPGPAASASSGHLSPKMGRRGPLLPGMSSPYSGGGGGEHVIRTTAPSSTSSPPQQGPMTFTRALEVTDSLQQQQQQQQIIRGGGGRIIGVGPQQPPPSSGDGGGNEGGGRDSVYDMNYEISV